MIRTIGEKSGSAKIDSEDTDPVSIETMSKGL